MTNSRNIATDATFMILYIGLSFLMVSLTVTLIAVPALGVEFGPVHVAAAAANLIGWTVLPFAPRLYKKLLGQSFEWRSNGVLGGAA
ncbi:MAG TPA: hypothetical protein VJ045_02685 [Hyphomicrobiaceae bacterium]|nr:hypothetical protein [Hyphomicrobiaceae bacterium]